MTFIKVFVKKGVVMENIMHWRQVIKLFDDLSEFNGQRSEFIFIDLDEKKILSSQNCFNLIDLREDVVKKILQEFDYKEV